MLLGNHSVLHKLPIRFFGGSTTSVEVQVPSNFQKSGSNRNTQYVSDRVTVLALYAIPSGNSAGKTWMLPQKSGEMSSRNACNILLEGAGAILGGITTTGSSSFTLSPVATGSLIAFGIGSTTMTFTVNGTLVAVIEGAGSASMSITVNPAILGALASGSGTANITTSVTGVLLPLDDTSPLRTASASFAITGTALRLPLNDSPPARTASASFAFGGALTSYAIGQMIGSTEDLGVLTPASIASSVWAATASENNEAGTMGNKLNTASSGGVDTEALAAAVWASTLRTLTGYVNADVKKVNGVTIIGAGVPGNTWGPG